MKTYTSTPSLETGKTKVSQGCVALSLVRPVRAAVTAAECSIRSAPPALRPSTQRSRTRGSLVGLALLAIVGMPTGCQGEYRGTVITPAVQKVVLYNIEGTYGEEFTRMLAAEIPAACRGLVSVVRANGVPQLAGLKSGDSPSSHIRDIGAQAYITGGIRRSEQVQLNKYYVMGTFELHDPSKEAEIGAVPDARYVGDVDFGVNWAAGRVGPESAQNVHQVLAWWVAKQLAKGLGY